MTSLRQLHESMCSVFLLDQVEGTELVEDRECVRREASKLSGLKAFRFTMLFFVQHFVLSWDEQSTCRAIDVRLHVCMQRLDAKSFFGLPSSPRS